MFPFLLFAEAGPRFTALHWHGDIFDLPEGAAPLAASAMTELQAFRYGAGAYGILFHPEATLPIIEGMAAAFPDELREAGVNADDILQQSRDYLPALQRIGAGVFEHWAGLALN